MKTEFYCVLLMGTFTGISNGTDAQNANTALSNLISPTAINVNLLPDKDNKRDLGSADKSWKNIYLDGSVYLGDARFLAWQTGTGTGNTAVGAAVLNANTTGYANTATGFNAMVANTTGFYNTADGYRALYFNTEGYSNTATGRLMLQHWQQVLISILCM